MSRTVNEYGVRLGTFTADTTPTDTEVQSIIEVTMPEIADIIGDDIPEYLWDDAATVASIRVAMQVEIAFFSEQIASNRSAYPALKDKFTETVANLSKQVTASVDGSTGAVVSGTTNSSSWSFPQPSNWLGGRW
jgi:DNA-directed RNA polymerase